MNINLKLKVPLISTDNPTDSTILNIDSTLFLSPMYALEEDIRNPFDSILDEHLPWIRKVLFNASLTTFRLTLTLESNSMLSPSELALLRRDLTICMAVSQTAKLLHKQTESDLTRSKSLGDFSVMTRKTTDLGFLKGIVADSDKCISDLKNLIEDIKLSNILPSSFVKGSSNERTLKVDRLWWLSSHDDRLVDGYASKKFEYKGRKWKAGEQNFSTGSN